MKWYTHRSKRAEQKGFSLIEMLVSVGLFTIVMTISVGTLLALVNANQKALSLKSVINNLNFAVESMSRNIRTGRVYYCTDGSSIPSTLPLATADCLGGASGLVFTDDQGVRVAYRFRNNQIERSKVDGSSWIALSALEVVIDDMRFYVTGTGVGDEIQPTVTISIRGHSGVKVETDSSFNIETTVTKRVLDQ